LQLIQKVKNNTATPEEKLAILKELNASSEEFKHLLDDLLGTAKSKEID